MESDRELLELAAKAGGVNIDDWNGEYPVVYVEHWSGYPNDMPDREVTYWNPLTDDGDALRLAVKLHMTIDVLPWGATAKKWDDVKTDIDAIRHDGDPFAATRRAIVRAAAEIGRTL